MCCFSREVKSVTKTNIFARDSKSPKQFLAYSMNFSAAEDLAMILPIPVPKGTGEKELRFINLEKYPDFFVEMGNGFPKVASVKPSPDLKVVDVGAYEASFVPTINDFGRLDERFRLPAGTWEKLPQYRSFGFAVFKLKAGNDHKAHPMAFEFPRADPGKLFFPTVHIHDGLVHDKAKFDHTLYAQFVMAPATGWHQSRTPASMFMNIDKSEGLVDKVGHVHRQTIRGEQPNKDIEV